MKKQLLHLGLIAAATACGLQLSAKPAKTGLLSVPTADGSHLTVRLTGDEFYHQYFTEDGYPLFEKDGNFYYCDFDVRGNLIDSGIKAGEIAARPASARSFLAGIDKSSLEARIERMASRSPRRASLQTASASFKAPAKAGDDTQGPPYERGYGLFPDLRFPAYGDQKAIVILVEYTDVKFSSNYRNNVSAADYFTRMLNEDDFADYGGTGSAAQYFRENSGGSFRPQFDVYGPVLLAHNQAYYGGNDYWGNDQRPAEMVKEACELLDDEVDFSEYDRNGDGVVDNVFIFYAGRGEASGGSSNTVWPHSWSMTAAGYSNLKFDGVRVHTYGCTNEWENGRPDGVGTFVHEFSHVMGLPDLYATSYTSSFTPGSWSALDYGPYNNEGMTPPNYGAFERYALGWVKPREVDRAVSATLQAVSENVCGIIRSSNPKEFFLLENRQQTGWDKYIPGHGMLVWHVQYEDAIWTSNTVNNSPSHQYVDIEEADGTQSDYSRDGDPFPGVSYKTSFTPNTNPAMKTWNGTAVDFPITNIDEEDGIITFDVLGGAVETVESLRVNEATEVGADTFTLSWEAPADGNEVIVNVYSLREGAAPASPAKAHAEEDRVYLNGFRNRNVGNATSVTVTNAAPSTDYYYTVQQSSGWYVSDCTEGSVSTTRYTIDYYAVEANEASNISDTGFTATWKPLEEATSYEINLFTLEPGEPNFDENNFDEAPVMAYGWTTTASSTYSIASYSGKDIPALRLSNGQNVTTPTYADYVKSISFWSRGNNTTVGDLVKVYAVLADGTEVVDSVQVDKAVGGQVSEITGFPARTLGVILEFCRKGTTGALAIDDVVVAHGLNFTAEPVEGLTAINVGDATEYTFANLLPDTDYGYQVRATDGSLFSRPSEMVMLKTAVGNGIGQVSDTPFVISVAGNTVLTSTDDEIIVSDFTGVTVARGARKVTLPRAGLYIVSVPAQKLAKKIIVR